MRPIAQCSRLIVLAACTLCLNGCWLFDPGPPTDCYDCHTECYEGPDGEQCDLVCYGSIDGEGEGPECHREPLP